MFVSDTKLKGMAREQGFYSEGPLYPGDLIKFNLGKCKVLCQGWNNFMQQDRLEARWVKSSSA